LTPPERRSPAYALQRLTLNVGVALGGTCAGLIATVAHPRSFDVLFLINCATFLAYIAVLTRVPTPELHPERERGRWRDVASDRVFVAYTCLNAVFMAAAISLMVELLPAFAKNVTHVNERQVGIIFALDSIGIVVFQLPVAKVLEGRRRMKGLAAMGIVWAVSLMLVWTAGEWTQTTVAALVLCGASLVFALGECVHGAIHVPLGADLAPPRLLGRYLALWPIAAAANLVCAAGALALERRLPENVRITPLGAGSAG
jgi:predicted MFS family arabinose efflux permease